MLDGQEGHRYVEDYCRDGTTPPQTEYMGRVVGDILAHLPEPGTARVEQRVKIDTGAADWYFHGRLDAYVYPSRIVDPKFYSEASRRYMHSTESLRTDPQCLIYSAWADATPVEFTMLYVIKPPRTKRGKAKAEPVRVVLTDDEIDRGLDALDSIAEQIVYWYTHVTDPNDVPHNADAACGGTGIGCDYAAHCRLF